MQGILDYIFPHRCVHCHRILNDRQLPLCQNCFHALPFTHFHMDKQNSVYQSIASFVEIDGASALLVYEHGNAVQKLIMANKYYNLSHIGSFLAELATEDLKNQSYDVILCIPSHHRTKLHRGYNQVVSFAEKLSENLQVEFRQDVIRRTRRRDSQTHRNRAERQKSMENTFVISDEVQQYQNILLVDDVLTTGATLSSCCREIKKKYNGKLFAYTMAKVEN